MVYLNILIIRKQLEKGKDKMIGKIIGFISAGVVLVIQTGCGNGYAVEYRRITNEVKYCESLDSAAVINIMENGMFKISCTERKK